jgi:hypothetical protein
MEVNLIFILFFSLFLVSSLVSFCIVAYNNTLYIFSFSFTFFILRGFTFLAMSFFHVLDHRLSLFCGMLLGFFILFFYLFY